MKDIRTVNEAIRLLEIDIALEGLIDLGLVEETEINGEPHLQLADADGGFEVCTPTLDDGFSSGVYARYVR